MVHGASPAGTRRSRCLSCKCPSWFSSSPNLLKNPVLQLLYLHQNNSRVNRTTSYNWLAEMNIPLYPQCPNPQLALPPWLVLLLLFWQPSIMAWSAVKPGTWDSWYKHFPSPAVFLVILMDAQRLHSLQGLQKFLCKSTIWHVHLPGDFQSFWQTLARFTEAMCQKDWAFWTSVNSTAKDNTLNSVGLIYSVSSKSSTI